jgi:hypothetical protein
MITDQMLDQIYSWPIVLVILGMGLAGMVATNKHRSALWLFGCWPGLVILLFLPSLPPRSSFHRPMKADDLTRDHCEHRAMTEDDL